MTVNVAVSTTARQARCTHSRRPSPRAPTYRSTDGPSRSPTPLADSPPAAPDASSSRFMTLIGDRPLDVHIAREYTFDQIPAAHHALGDHHLAELAIAIG